ncbi:MAG TPA: hypothetical protein VG755_44860, partial [Nannocystaceae bacterium]|nr:hypothetical protein [Nannocystaceae bacterium]
SIDMTRRAVVSSTRRTVAAKGGGDECVTLDDRPLALQTMRDGKRVLAILPYEIWVLHAETLEVEKTIELASAEPSVCEGDEDGTLWFGGAHLHRGSVWSAKAEKFGSKLGGFVDEVAMLRPRLLCGVGTQGEVLLDVEKEDVAHRRKTSDHEVLGLLGSADGRAVWIDGSNHAWVIDPEHPSGYMKLKLRNTSAADVPSEAIVALASTSAGHCVLAARDGAIAWTNRALRPIGEKVPAIELRGATPLAIAGDERWIYVLRPGATLHRFLVEQPVWDPPPGPKQPEPPPLPEAQAAKLPRAASCMALLPGGALVLAGPQADDQLGRLWQCNTEELPWTELKLRARTLVEPEPAPNEPEGPKTPSFVPTRSKLAGAPLAQLRVDDVIGGAHPFWVTRASGTLAERPVEPRRADEVLAADALLLPAMVRVHEGTARPALLLWPGVADDLHEIPPIEWLTWGDRPREWIALRTPEIRAQGWSRRGVFPLQVALAGPPPQVAGRRVTVPARWADAELFAALVKECKHLLKVLW